ncbi:aminotransferase class III-fold pyridoxal phosphate-dependent enzyme, partial [Akkermansiaceae bacterium]|nr:aminotransferase class III-fold pyridoxal phosphate-dependent enzyme [Akkermansiaceae bacterium]
TVTRGEGTRVWDELGREYLDFCSGIAVCSLGHCHPALTQTIAEQSATLMHCSNLYYIEQQADLAKLIVEKVVGHPGKIFFSKRMMGSSNSHGDSGKPPGATMSLPSTSPSMVGLLEP